MYSKKRNIIFICVMVAVVVLGIFLVIKKEDKNPYDGNMGGQSDMQSDNGSDVQTELATSGEDEALLKEKQEFFDKMKEAYLNPLYHKGGYGKCSGSMEVNRDFVAEKTVFRNAYDMVEYEFLEYEELDNISKYVSGINWEASNNLTKMGFDDIDIKYINTGIMNKDGTFNKVRRIENLRYAELDYGEDIIYEEQEIVAVRIKVKYKNLSSKKNALSFEQMHQVGTLVQLDDGKFYDKYTVYVSSRSFTLEMPVYTSMANKYSVSSGAIKVICPGEISLNPNEEYIGELIYLGYKDELDDMYFISAWGGTNNDIHNMNAVGVNFVPFSYLREQVGVNVEE